MQVCLVLYLERQSVEIVSLGGCVATRLADPLLHLLALEDVLAEVLLACGAKQAFKLVEEEVKELLGVALDGCVCGLTFKVLVGETELGRVDVASI